MFFFSSSFRRKIFHWSSYMLMGGLTLSAKSYRVKVTPAAVDRSGVIVRFTLPVDAPRAAAIDSSGHSFPLQVSESGEACFVIADLKANESPSFTLGPKLTSRAAGISVLNREGDLEVKADGASVLSYRTDKNALPRENIPDKFKRAGYLHPVFSPDGHVVTGDYPANHVHHHGIWTSWSQTEFQGRKPNFWEMAQETGTVEFVAVDRTWSGPVHGGFLARQQMKDLVGGVIALNESWELTVYAVSSGSMPVRMFDLAITQTCATSDPVVLSQYHYGNLGFRGPDSWDGKDNLLVLTSEGATNRDLANATRARWCYLGPKKGAKVEAGIAILGSPENFRAPQPIRVHPEMPFFSFAPTLLGAMTIAPGRPYVAHYRFVVSDNPPSRESLDAFWNGYALPAVAVVEAR